MSEVDIGNQLLARHEVAALEAFQEIQLQKLRANAHKGGWRDADTYRLLQRLRDEVGELEGALAKLWTYEPGEQFTVEKGVRAIQVARECADVANFCLFIADVAGGLSYDKGANP